MFFMFDYDAWFEAVQYEADLYGVKYMIPSEMKDDPVVQQAFRDDTAPDDFVFTHLLNESSVDDEEEDE